MKTETEIQPDLPLTRKSSIDAIAQADRDLQKLAAEESETQPGLRAAAADPFKAPRELREAEIAFSNRRRAILDKRSSELGFLETSVPAPLIEFEVRLSDELKRWNSYGPPSNVADYGRKNRRENALRSVLEKIKPLRFSVASIDEALIAIVQLESELANWNSDIPSEVVAS